MDQCFLYFAKDCVWQGEGRSPTIVKLVRTRLDVGWKRVLEGEKGKERRVKRKRENGVSVVVCISRV